LISAELSTNFGNFIYQLTRQGDVFIDYPSKCIYPPEWLKHATVKLRLFSPDGNIHHISLEGGYFDWHYSGKASYLWINTYQILSSHKTSTRDALVDTHPDFRNDEPEIEISPEKGKWKGSINNNDSTKREDIVNTRKVIDTFTYIIITKPLTRLCHPLNFRFFWFLSAQQAERRMVQLHTKEIPEECGDRMAIEWRILYSQGIKSE